MKPSHAFSLPVCALVAALAVSAPACRAQETPASSGPAPAPAPASAAPASGAASAPAPATGRKPAAPMAGGASGFGALPGFPAPEPPDPETQALQKELMKAQMRMQLRQLKLQEELAPQTEAAQKAAAKAAADGELAALQKDVQKLQIEAQLRQAKAQAELAAMNEETARVAAKLSWEKAKRDADRAAAQEADDKANFELQQKLAAGARKNRELQAQVEALAAEAGLAQARLAEENRRLSLEEKKLQAQLQAKEVKDKAAAVVLGADLVYADEPFKDGVLTITDRRVELNGVIWAGSVKPVVDRIAFLANQSDKPIFLVIDSSPGGSVAAGYQVIKAMESSRAPVHVVVKSFAASMAATICTLAPHSYAYSDAIILHHQMSYGMGGNITQQKEALERSKQWYERLAGPVAKKMGITLDELVKKMYAHDSGGDWEEFADNAQKLRWVDHVATEVRETGLREKPKDEAPSLLSRLFGMAEQRDDRGRPFVQLPHLDAHDCWFLTNRDGYYRE